MSGLSVSTVGAGRPSIVFLHGLFGQGRNWTTIAKGLLPRASLLIDLPDHGDSAWSSSFSYQSAADTVADQVREIAHQPVTVVGHSMGGKVAMMMALRHPELVARLAVIDIAPTTRDSSAFGVYLDAMLGMNLNAITSRKDADKALAAVEPDREIRGFLLQSLQRTDAGGWRWQPNLRLLHDNLNEIGGWPAEVAGTYPGPVLWLAGEWSGYVRDEDTPVMRRWFPRVRKVTIKNAGHWLHSEQPDVVIDTLTMWLDATDQEIDQPKVTDTI